MIRVLVVDDDTLTAEAHALYVGRLDGFEVTGVAHTGGEALRLVAEAGPDGIDLVLLDMTLPDMHGLGSAAGCGRPGVRPTSWP